MSSPRSSGYSLWAVDSVLSVRRRNRSCICDHGDMARVRLHTGNPPEVTVPVGGARDVRGSDPEFAHLRRPGRTPLCQWCGGPSQVDGENPRRCKRCRKLDNTISAAASYMATHGLRALGGSVESESDDELRHRQAARKAQSTLASVKQQPRKQSTAGKARPAKRPVSKVTIKASKLAKWVAAVDQLDRAIARESRLANSASPSKVARMQRLIDQRDLLKRRIADEHR